MTVSDVTSSQKLPLSKRVLILLTLAPLLTCKTRDQSSALRVDNNPRPGSSPEVSAIAHACSAVKSPYFVEAKSDSIVYSTVEHLPDPVQVSFDTGSATPMDGGWRLTNVFTETSLPTCIRGQSLLTMGQFLFALRCAQLDPCPRPKNSCVDCVAQAMPQGVVGDPSSFMEPSQLALTDDLECRQTDTGAQLSAGATKIGVPTDFCEELKATRKDNFICAWNGRALVPFEIDSGTPMIERGNSAGLVDLAACAAGVRQTKHNIVCTFDGAGFAPYTLRNGEVEKLGDAAGTLAGQCGELIGSYNGGSKGGSMCIRSSGAYGIHKLGTPVAKGIFPSLSACKASLLAPAKKSKPSPVATNKNPEQGAGSGFGLRGVGFDNFKRCENRRHDNHLTRHSGRRGRKTLDCHFDTLYSWGPHAKVQWLANRTNRNWQGEFKRNGKPSPIFATTNPIGSHAYGDYLIRLKLLYSTKIRFYESNDEGYDTYQACEQSGIDQEKWILARYYKKDAPVDRYRHFSGLDFIICGPGVLHSWSYAGGPTDKEIDRAIYRYNNYNHHNYETYFKLDGVDALASDYFHIDGKPWTLKHLNKVTSFQKQIRGYVYLNKKAGRYATKENHYNTKRPIYFNPD